MLSTKEFTIMSFVLMGFGFLINYQLQGICVWTTAEYVVQYFSLFLMLIGCTGATIGLLLDSKEVENLRKGD